MLSLAIALSLQLDKRLIELDCQGLALKQTCATQQSVPSSTAETRNNAEQSVAVPPSNATAIEQRLLNDELKVPDFHGNPSKFGPFWKLFEELVHKQPYSNMEKLSILLNCCKGDAARALRMIPRTGDSYERTIQQLKSQYEDPKRVTMQMIRQLKTMKPCRDDPRSLRNNLSDMQAIISTIQRQGEVVDTTYMTSMVIDTLSKGVQEEITRKEFDLGKEWTMEELLENLTIAVKRREHIESRKEDPKEGHNVFLIRAKIDPTVRCAGCEQSHVFKYCKKYPTVFQKIERVRALHACWKCFSQHHTTSHCCKGNFYKCGGAHNMQSEPPISLKLC